MNAVEFLPYDDDVTPPIIRRYVSSIVGLLTLIVSIVVGTYYFVFNVVGRDASDGKWTLPLMARFVRVNFSISKLFASLSYPKTRRTSTTLVISDVSVARKILSAARIGSIDSPRQYRPEPCLKFASKLLFPRLDFTTLSEIVGEIIAEIPIESNRRSINECLKEIVILLEAKANRSFVVDLPTYSVRHVYNVLGVCVFGKKVTRLTNSRCDFYELCNQLSSIADISIRDGRYRLANNSIGLEERLKTEIENCLKNSSGEVEEDCLINRLNDRLKIANYREPAIISILIALCVHSITVMSKLIAVILYELAGNQEIQKQLRENVSIPIDNEGRPRLNDDSLKNQTILDRILKESLRKYPTSSSVTLINRNEPYDVPNANLRVNRDANIIIPIYDIHNDDSVYPNSDHFQPDRFLRKPNDRDDDHDNIENPEPLMEFVFNTGNLYFDEFVKNFTFTHVKAVVACLIQQYEFSADDTGRKSFWKYRSSNNIFENPVIVSSVENQKRSIPFLKSLNEWKIAQKAEQDRNFLYRLLF